MNTAKHDCFSCKFATRTGTHNPAFYCEIMSGEPIPFQDAFNNCIMWAENRQEEQTAEKREETALPSDDEIQILNGFLKMCCKNLAIGNETILQAWEKVRISAMEMPVYLCDESMEEPLYLCPRCYAKLDHNLDKYHCRKCHRFLNWNFFYPEDRHREEQKNDV